MRVKRFPCVLLALLLLISLFTVSVSAGEKALWGGSYGGGNYNPSAASGSGTFDPSNVNHGMYRNFFQVANRGWLSVRMCAVPWKAGNEQDYFSIDPSAQEMYMYEHGKLTEAPNYSDGNWIYFSNGTSGYEFTIYQGFDDGVVKSAMYDRYSSKAQQLLDICGYTGGPVNFANGAELDAVFHSAYMDDPHNVTEKRRALGEFFGLSGADAENFYIVVELLPICQEYTWGTRSKADGGGYGYISATVSIGGFRDTLYEFYTTESLATYASQDVGYGSHRCTIMYGDGSGTRLVSYDGGITLAKYLEGTTKIRGELFTWNQGGVENGCLPGYTVPNWNKSEVNGYSIYSFGDNVPLNSGANIAVEYQGEVNTSEPNKFVSTGSLIGAGDSTSLAYYDFRNNRFIDSDDNATLLQFSKIDTSSVYALCFTSADTYKVGNKIQLLPTLESSFTTAPGQGYRSNSLTWGSFPVSGFGVGSVWRVALLESRASTAAIAERFESAFNSATLDGDLVIPSSSLNTTTRYRDAEVLTGSAANMYQALGTSSVDVMETVILNPDSYNSRVQYNLVKDEDFGVGYEFIIKGSPVTSRKITFTIEAYADLSLKSISSEQTWLENYTTVKETSCGINPEAIGWVIVPGLDNQWTSSIDSGIRSLTMILPDPVNESARSSTPTNVLFGTSLGDISLGSTQDSPPIGYTVYEFIIKYDPNMPPLTGEVVLPSYMLNRYFDNIIQTSSMRKYGFAAKYSLAEDWTRWEWVGAYCSACSHHHDWIEKANYTKHYGIEYYDSATGNEFGEDNSKLDRYFPVATNVWDGANREKLTQAWNVSEWTEGFGRNQYIVDYGFNLIRAQVKDYRAFSGISMQSYSATGDSNDVLKLKSYFGVVPSSSVASASSSRDSLATVGSFTEAFSIESRFALTGKKEGSHPIQDTPHTCTNYVPCDIHGYDYCCSGYSIVWKDFTVTCTGFYNYLGAKVPTVDYRFDSVVYKYQTLPMASGWNGYLGGADGSGTKQFGALPTSLANKATANNVNSKTAYRFATVRYNGADLKYYPETYMMYLAGDYKTIASLPTEGGGFKYSAGYVMGEVQRTAKSSSMYFFKVNTVNDGDTVTSFPGTVYSDAMQGGSSILGMGSMVSIPAGADVTIAADPNGIQLDMYGYALDIVQTSDDGNLGAIGSSGHFKGVVADGEDVYSIWGNNTRSIIDKHFEDWCTSILDVKNFGADFKLYVNNGLQSENFSATIGRIDRTNATPVQEGVYQIVIEKGILQTGKGDYNALIKQIALDYFSDASQTAKAKELFEASGLYQTIINAMETCKNDLNKSGLTNTDGTPSEWTDVIGGDGNWYDEVSRTFVIRRYKSEGNMICDVIATDKIDYQLAPTGSSKPGENMNAGTGYDAKWELNIFFDQAAADRVNELLLDWSGTGNYYKPQEGNTGNTALNNANSQFTVLVDGMYVSNADFIIPASSTQDFYN